MVDTILADGIGGLAAGRAVMDWVRSGGFFNATFTDGTENNITAATIIGGADSEAEYFQSLSDDLPYWVVSAETGAGTLGRVADTAADSGWALRWNGAEDATIFQDAPAAPGRRYSLRRRTRWTDGINGDFGITLRWLDVNRVEISNEVMVPFLTNIGSVATQATYDEEQGNPSGKAPAGTRWVRWEVRYQTLAAGSLHIASLRCVESEVGDHYLHEEGYLNIKTTAGHEILSGGLDTQPPGSESFYILEDGEMQWAGASILSFNGTRMVLDGAGIEINAAEGVGLFVTGGAYMLLEERASGAPAAPSGGRVALYCKDNGAGKTQLVCKFATGVEQVLATQP